MIFNSCLRLERDFALYPLTLVIPDPVFHFLSLDLSRSSQGALFFTRFSFPPLITRMGRQPRGMGICSHFKRLLEVEDQ